MTETPLFVSGYVLWFPSPLSGVVTETSRHHGRRSELLFPSPHSKRKECAFRPGRNDEAGIRALRMILLTCSPEFNQLNFQAVEYTDAKGEKRPTYLLTKRKRTVRVGDGANYTFQRRSTAPTPADFLCPDLFLFSFPPLFHAGRATNTRPAREISPPCLWTVVSARPPFWASSHRLTIDQRSPK
ncbi:MAG: hypothetical protein D084_Lepto4C00626G0007 [Leptospirillum sp. Group IV 'UBA BS']|nr:MAG: hypothetical protein D084_Lepto4C00626G0007 [Leptospirillum sp. Group IV 'UBA BS']